MKKLRQMQREDLQIYKQDKNKKIGLRKKSFIIVQILFDCFLKMQFGQDTQVLFPYS